MLVNRGPEANKLEGGFQNGACQHQCPRGRTSPQNGFHQCLCPQGELKLPLASPGDSPKSAGCSDPGSFQIIASALCPGVCEILCAPFKNRVSIFHSTLALSRVSPAGLQSQMFWGLIFLVQDPQTGEPNVGFRPFAPWRGPLQL